LSSTHAPISPRGEAKPAPSSLPPSPLRQAAPAPAPPPPPPPPPPPIAKSGKPGLNSAGAVSAQMLLGLLIVSVFSPSST
jgi:hypothetical protein